MIEHLLPPIFAYPITTNSTYTIGFHLFPLDSLGYFKYKKFLVNFNIQQQCSIFSFARTHMESYHYLISPLVLISKSLVIEMIGSKFVFTMQ